ncbi:hypothetical protein BH23ACT8_BH23ACT8_24920 [soil metagenome]
MTATACTYCHAAALGPSTAVCPACRTRQHLDCRAEAGGCTTPGCDGGVAAASAAAMAAVGAVPPPPGSPAAGVAPHRVTAPPAHNMIWPASAEALGQSRSMPPASAYGQWPADRAPAAAFGGSWPAPTTARAGWPAGRVLAAIGAAVVVVFLLFTAVAGGNEDAELAALAQDTCDAIDGETFLVAGVILQSATRQAGARGFSASELGDSMWDSCPGLMGQVEEFLDDFTNGY